jgi:hypothetical protein
MNILSRDKKIEIIAALAEGLGIRATARITGVNRETVGTLALRVGRGCFELHDRMMVGIRVNRQDICERKAEEARTRAERSVYPDEREAWHTVASEWTKTARQPISCLMGKRTPRR